jgi:predicted NBD/HSP70 family sugar kinase
VKSPIVSLQGAGVLGSNRDVVRQHNLSIILQMIHFYGTVTRSQLTSSTGLNRSTISDLVSELEQLGFAYESEAASGSGVGRPSLVVSASTKVVAFAVHPEIDATTVGLVSLAGKVLKTVRVAMGPNPTAADSVKTAAKAISEFRNQLEPDQRIAGIGVAIPGQVRVSDNVVRFAPQLGWVEQPFGSMLSQATGLPVFVDNDASIGCMAERNFGAARGLLDAVYLFAGSGGIGGGAIVNGIQLRGTSGYGGEFGHVRIGGSNDVDYSGLSGTLESLVRRDDLLHVFKMYSATDRELDQEIRSTKSKEAIKILRKQVDSLGAGISTYVNIFNPEAIILGGFLTSLFDFDPERLLEVMKSGTIKAAQERVVIRNGELGEETLMVGSAELAFRAILENPGNAQLVPVRKSR